MYSVLDYGRMASDSVRMDAYARAIARAVKPGSVVLDLGSGTGIFALLAVRAGAARVHAVDINPALWLVPELAAENGAADRIVIHQESSLELDLQEKADVIVSDMRGITPLCSDHVGAIRDARSRWLKPGGVLIPARDRLFVALVEAPAMWAQFAQAWESFETFGFVAKAARTAVLNSILPDRGAPLVPSDVVTTSAPWATLDYATYDGASIDTTVELETTRTGVAHGLAVWFEATTFEDIGYTSAPGWSLAYSRYFMPLLEPVRLAMGDRARITMRADARGDRWAWDTDIRTSGGESKAHFRQSTFLGTPTHPSALLRSSMQFKPALSPRGERLSRLLASMDGEKTVTELVEAWLKDGPSGSGARDSLVEELREAVTTYGR